MSEEREDQHGVHRLCDMIQNSATRIKLVVYPSLFAFTVLAAYGFYLIYNVTNDLSTLTQSVDRNMTAMTQSIAAVTENMDRVEKSLASIDGKMNNLEPIRQEMAMMRHNMHIMTGSTRMMQRNMQQISRPASFMSSFMPW